MVSQVFLLPLFLIVECAATEYWVTPDSTSNCNTRQPCLTLSEYVQNTSHYFTSNSVLHFLSGNHTISKTTWVIVQDVENISLAGSAGHATVHCNGRLSFTFERVVDLQISSIGFIKCGLEVTDDLRYVHAEPTRIGYFVHELAVQLQVALLFAKCSSVVLRNVTVMESYGYGLLGYNMMAELNHCLFHHNYWRPKVHSNMHSSPKNNSLLECKAGGNALFVYTPVLPFHPIAPLNILHSEFAYGRNLYETSAPGSELLHGGGGLGIHIEAGYSSVRAHDMRYLTFKVITNITIYNCSIYRNTASIGANMLLAVHMPLGNSMTVHINHCKFFWRKEH